MEGHYDLIGVFARSQIDYPKGIGVRHSLFVKRRILGDKLLENCTRQELNQLIWELRKEHKWMKQKLKEKDANIS
mgnify:CR=1 FL=1